MDSSVDNRLLGLKIAYFRKKNRLTQVQLANQVHISVRYMSKIECGQVTNCVSLPVLHSISKVLGVSIDTLLKNDE